MCLFCSVPQTYSLFKIYSQAVLINGRFSQNTKILFVFPPKFCISIFFNFSWNDFDTFLFQAVLPRGSDRLMKEIE